MKTRIMIWGRAGARCSFPTCRKNLIYDATDFDDASLVGDLAHIVADSPDGPRGNATLPQEERGEYSNLLLLCKIHHKLIDDQPNTFPITQLHQMKSDHETWVKNLFPHKEPRQSDREVYADILTHLEEAAGFSTWNNWTYSVVGADGPLLELDRFHSLNLVRTFLLSRLWPERHPSLENALINFGEICGDLCSVFSKYSTINGDSLATRRFYHREQHPWGIDQELLKEYTSHVGLIEDLAIELTRAANYLCDKVRESFDPKYRISEGAFLITVGPVGRGFNLLTLRAEYHDTERTPRPYQGLESFAEDRKHRISSFGRRPDQDSTGE